jgi:hypothetical protein
MTVAPSVGWTAVRTPGYVWGDANTIGSPPALPTLNHANSPAVQFEVATEGTFALMGLTGTFTQGSCVITSVASTTDVVLGQILEGVGIGSVAQYLPYAPD